MDCPSDLCGRDSGLHSGWTLPPSEGLSVSKSDVPDRRHSPEHHEGHIIQIQWPSLSVLLCQEIYACYWKNLWRESTKTGKKEKLNVIFFLYIFKRIYMYNYSIVALHGERIYVWRFENRNDLNQGLYYISKLWACYMNSMKWKALYCAWRKDQSILSIFTQMVSGDWKVKLALIQGHLNFVVSIWM